MSNKQPLVVLKTPLRWSRTSLSVIDSSDCEYCGAQNVPCLVTDTSDEEYGATSLCLPCIQDGFTRYQAQP
jgi:hypothetical protein